jgi:hypothetical protein
MKVEEKEEKVEKEGIIEVEETVAEAVEETVEIKEDNN